MLFHYFSVVFAHILCRRSSVYIFESFFKRNSVDKTDRRPIRLLMIKINKICRYNVDDLLLSYRFHIRYSNSLHILTFSMHMFKRLKTSNFNTALHLHLPYTALLPYTCPADSGVSQSYKSRLS